MTMTVPFVSLVVALHCKHLSLTSLSTFSAMYSIMSANPPISTEMPFPTNPFAPKKV